jgi:hypothetical protein
MLPPKKWKTVKQPVGSRCCGIAVAAMVVGKGLRYAMNRMPDRRHRDGQRWARTRDILSFLGSHGIVMGMWVEITSGELQPDQQLSFSVQMSDRPAILSIRSRIFPGYYHYLFWDGSIVRDPSPSVAEELPLEAYNVLEVIPLIYLDERPQARKKEIMR